MLTSVQLKETYGIVAQLRDQSGFHWDEVRGACITAESEAVWRAYIDVCSDLSQDLLN